jgi:hypothetical protein
MSPPTRKQSETTKLLPRARREPAADTEDDFEEEERRWVEGAIEAGNLTPDDIVCAFLRLDIFDRAECMHRLSQECKRLREEVPQ